MVFVPQLASLVLGYNFGAFQIINLSSLQVDCASPYEADAGPVVSFAVQEPENDPKNFVYLWLVRSGEDTEASCTLYHMTYDSKVVDVTNKLMINF